MRSTWSIYKKLGDYWSPDGTFYRPNDVFITTQLSTQSKTQRADGGNTYTTPSTKYIYENLTFAWFYDDGTMRNKIDNYIESHDEIKIVDHSSNEYTGRFIATTPNWLVGESPDKYDLQVVFERMPLITASSSSSSSSLSA